MVSVALEKKQASSGDNSWKLESSGMVCVGGGRVGHVCASVTRCDVCLFTVCLFLHNHYL